jgi:hypothetical protein
LRSRAAARFFAAGELFHFSPVDIHRVRHAGSELAVTLHAYSPPRRRMGAYTLREDGVLARRSMSYSQELRPLQAVGAADPACPRPSLNTDPTVV